MLKKIFYGVAGVIGFFILLIIIVPTPKTTPTQETNNTIVNENTNEVAVEEATVSDTDEDEPTPTESTTNNSEDEIVTPTAEDKTTQSDSTSDNSQNKYYSISSVVDGDTVKINVDGEVQTFRLIGMDTPETVDPRKPVQCFGVEASNKAKELLTNKKVRIEKDPTQGELDKYGRHLAYIYREDGLFYNKYMIEQGYAYEYTYDTPYKYQTQFRAAQKSAQENLRGLWSPDTCNGDTSSDVATPTTPTTPTPPPATDTTSQTTTKYYTSSYRTTKYYYPASCSGWKDLSPTYLKGFDSLEALLAAYPSRTLSPECQ